MSPRIENEATALILSAALAEVPLHERTRNTLSPAAASRDRSERCSISAFLSPGSRPRGGSVTGFVHAAGKGVIMLHSHTRERVKTLGAKVWKDLRCEGTCLPVTTQPNRPLTKSFLCDDHTK